MPRKRQRFGGNTYRIPAVYLLDSSFIPLAGLREEIHLSPVLQRKKIPDLHG